MPDVNCHSVQESHDEKSDHFVFSYNDTETDTSRISALCKDLLSDVKCFEIVLKDPSTSLRVVYGNLDTAVEHNYSDNEFSRRRMVLTTAAAATTTAPTTTATTTTTTAKSPVKDRRNCKRNYYA